MNSAPPSPPCVNQQLPVLCSGEAERFQDRDLAAAKFDFAHAGIVSVVRRMSSNWLARFATRRRPVGAIRLRHLPAAIPNAPAGADFALIDTAARVELQPFGRRCGEKVILDLRFRAGPRTAMRVLSASSKINIFSFGISSPSTSRIVSGLEIFDGRSTFRSSISVGRTCHVGFEQRADFCRAFRALESERAIFFRRSSRIGINLVEQLDRSLVRATLRRRQLRKT